MSKLEDQKALPRRRLFHSLEEETRFLFDVKEKKKKAPAKAKKAKAKR